MSVTIYGASDDLIEVEGDIREEFNPSDGQPHFLAFSDGTVLRVSYDGQWHITLAAEGAALMEHVPATGDEGYRDDLHTTPVYSDCVSLTGTFAWVVAGERFVVAS